MAVYRCAVHSIIVLTSQGSPERKSIWICMELVSRLRERGCWTSFAELDIHNAYEEDLLPRQTICCISEQFCRRQWVSTMHSSDWSALAIEPPSSTSLCIHNGTKRRPEKPWHKHDCLATSVDVLAFLAYLSAWMNENSHGYTGISVEWLGDLWAKKPAATANPNRMIRVPSVVKLLSL